MKIKSLPLAPCFMSYVEIVLSLPETTIYKPCENLIKSIFP